MKKAVLISIFIFALSILGSFATAPAARADFCWCLDTQFGVCGSHTADTNNIAFVCGPNGDANCNTYCTNQGRKAVHCDQKDLQWNTKDIAQNGCLKSTCWCKNATNTCKPYDANTKGNIFLSQNECNQFCTNLSGGWQAVFFDSTDPSVHYKDPLCTPVAAATPATPAAANTPGGNSNVTNLQQNAASHLNPGKFAAASDLIGLAIKILLSFIGSIAIVLYIYAGILWMTAFGNSERTAQATSIITWTTLAVMVMLGSYLIVGQILKILGV